MEFQVDEATHELIEAIRPSRSTTTSKGYWLIPGSRWFRRPVLS